MLLNAGNLSANWGMAIKISLEKILVKGRDAGQASAPYVRWCERPISSEQSSDSVY